MKKAVIALWAAIILSIAPAMDALYNSFIYITNNFKDKPLTLDGRGWQKGQKIVPTYKTKMFKGSYKDIKYPGYRCKVSNALAIPPEWKCVADARIPVPSTVEQKIVKDKIKIWPGQTVKVGKVDRDLTSLKLMAWQKKVNVKNPDPSRLRPALSPVYPYEALATSISGPQGRIDLKVIAERVGLPRAYAISSAIAITGASTFGAVIGIIGAESILGIIPGVIVFGGWAAAFALPVVTTVSQKSGLLVVPKTKGDYSFSYKSKLRFGNIYKDVYITIGPKKEAEKVEKEDATMREEARTQEKD